MPLLFILVKRSTGQLGEPKLRFFCDGLPRDIWNRCKEELRCLKCTKRYSDWRSLRKHMNFFCQMEPLYPCPYCYHRARIPTLLKYHIVREHAALTSSEETRIGPATLQSEDLGEYVGKPNFVCPKCGKGYAWKASLQRHLSTVCGTPPMLFCNICGYKTSRKDVLFRHMRHVHPRSQ
ncbi:zinc finger protein 121-like [Monomorium pharaonis]|uniref:zinc finger protein 121-like n=1 Tax=Monomorium pharaonis TaxID=307658 RepID=UPI00063FC6DD|nr:zinc finger protein 121-like [Monomorium pharaonis]